MSMSDWTVRALKRLPKNSISRAFGVLSDVELPRPVQKVVNHGFATLMDINIDEGQHPPGDYDSLNAYFTRQLRDGARPVASHDPEAVLSPVDGVVGAMGTIDDETLFQAKGRTYQLRDLVDSAAATDRFRNGRYATIYLSPRDYHRIHSPVSGHVVNISYIPGHLFPVNPFAVNHIDDLFAVNERLITYLDSPQLGQVAVIKVGATCVGRIELQYEPFKTNCRFRRRREFAPSEQIDVRHGEELAVFNLGSTVIVLIENDRFQFRKKLDSGMEVQMGEEMGRR